MTEDLELPRQPGQLVWCPADPSLGIGVVTAADNRKICVRFARMQGERSYTTRSAEHPVARYVIAQGERVADATGHRFRVTRRLPDSTEGLAVYELDSGQAAVESALVPDVRQVSARQRLAALDLVHPEVVRTRVQGLRLTRFGARPGHSAVLGARVQWLPHQVDVATRAIERDPLRMLLADEVGLGKTVEAALIYAGLRHEGRADRVLILTPESLCIQWLGEIYRKAHELLVLFDEPRLEDTLRDFADMNPFEAHRRIVCSTDWVANREGLAELAAAAPWDLVVVDEAHHLRWNPESGGNPGYRLLDALARNSRNLLLLTATPMALDPTEYHALLRLLDPARFDDPRSFGAVHKRVKAIRQVARSLVSAVEQRTAIDPTVLESARETLSDDPTDQDQLDHLALLAPEAPERAAEAERVLLALRERHGLADFVVRNRRGPVGGLPERRPQVFALEPTEAQQLLMDAGEAVMVEVARTLERPEDVGPLLRALWATPRALVDMLERCSPTLCAELAPFVDAVLGAPLDEDGLPTGDARLRWLAQQIRSLPKKQKLLVFAESATAVRALKDALEVLHLDKPAVFYRELSPRDQDRQVAWFRDPEGPAVMLSTEAGGEGRNFQFCHRVVLYDMPWQPATVEQRIGRVDRVGQKHDVHVLVPYFKHGYEAAIVKIMQDAIGVLDRTVGGIDPALEHVGGRIAELVLAEADADAWRDLYEETTQQVVAARERIASGVDPILDHASFSKERAQAVLGSVPQDLETRLERFVRGYAAHSRLTLHSKWEGRAVSVEGAPGAAGRDDVESYVATFNRTHALDHEDIELLSFGHPLVEQALEWADQSADASATLALCRGFAEDGAAFLWCFDLDLPDDVPEAAAYFDTSLFTIAVDEEGRRVPELEDLLEGSVRRLERMDAAPLKRSLRRWRALVDHTFKVAEGLADAALQEEVGNGQALLERSAARRKRDMLRAHARELARHGGREDDRDELLRMHEEQLKTLDADCERLRQAIVHARPRLLAAVAVRLVRAKMVSA